ncbi:hypothetical protein [Actinomadura alba]|uniref:Uncharacterized protein n=1 Tax=Actinomadura alba TaxID=406431 RepID=A0ABR7LIA9_9ACTN|nr:hypothetical protein [Actinomadura alba]MBC6464570.1 hypothetical protein [Actinomadura alba]
MSGREETPEPVEAPQAESGAAPQPQVPAAPPSFGNAGLPQPIPEPLDEPASPRARTVDHLDGPKAPWWETAPVADETDGTYSAADTDDVQHADEAAPAWRTPESSAPQVMPSSPDMLVAGPGIAAFDTRGALPTAQPQRRPKETGSPDFLDTDPDGIPIIEQAEPAAVPGGAFGGPPSNVPTSTGMSPPSEAAPAFDMTASAAASRADFAARLRAAGPYPAGGETATATMPPTAPQGAPSEALGAMTAPARPPDGGAPSPMGGPPAPGRGGRRRLLVVGGGAAAVLLISLAFIGVKAASGPAERAAPSTPAPRQSVAAPLAQPSTATPRPGRTAVTSIDSERTDRRPLAFTEVFPSSTISLGGRTYKQDKISVNHQCGLAARGAMAAALERGKCRSVVRATYVNGKKYAVTTGVAVMPTRAAALTANKAGDPSRYEWFRGMRGKVATKIDQAGGYASSTVRGRYIIYSYAQYVDGTRPNAADQALRSLTRQFIAYAVRPIERRAG